MAIGAASSCTNLRSLYSNKYAVDNVATHPGPKSEEQKKAVGKANGMTHLQAEVVKPHEPYKAGGPSPDSQLAVVGGLVDVRG